MHSQLSDELVGKNKIAALVLNVPVMVYSVFPGVCVGGGLQSFKATLASAESVKVHATPIRPQRQLSLPS